MATCWSTPATPPRAARARSSSATWPRSRGRMWPPAMTARARPSWVGTGCSKAPPAPSKCSPWLSTIPVCWHWRRLSAGLPLRSTFVPARPAIPGLGAWIHRTQTTTRSLRLRSGMFRILASTGIWITDTSNTAPTTEWPGLSITRAIRALPTFPQRQRSGALSTPIPWGPPPLRQTGSASATTQTAQGMEPAASPSTRMPRRPTSQPRAPRWFPTCPRMARWRF